MNPVAKELSLGAAVAIVGSYALNVALNIDVPLEVQAAAAVIVAAVPVPFSRGLDDEGC